MKSLPAFLLSLFIAFAAQAQTNTPTLVTNYVAAHPDFRIVNGQLYNRQKSVRWQHFKAEVLRVRPGLISLRENYRTQGTSSYPGNYIQSMGGYSPSLPGSATVEIDYGPKDGIIFLLRNYPEKDVAVGQTIHGKAMFICSTNLTGDMLELWDFGTPNIVPVVTTNSTSAKP